MKQKRIYNFLIGVGIFLLFIGVITKLMHWPFSAFFFTIAYVLILLAYPRLILLKEKKTIWDILKVVGVFVWGGFALLYMLYFPEHRTLFMALSAVGFISWLGFNFYGYIAENYSESNSINPLIRLAYIIGFGGLAIGMIFKIAHWPGAQILLMIGGTIAGLTFFYTTFIQSEE